MRMIWAYRRMEQEGVYPLARSHACVSARSV